MTDASIMEANANAALIRSGYDAFARGDVQGALAWSWRRNGLLDAHE